MNYGEQLASWYLRFNGFFPMPNFVVHREEDVPTSHPMAHNSDVDVLAVRLPHVFEAVGGNRRDWDWGMLGSLLPADRPAGVVVEVKTGREDVQPEFHRLERGIRRLGVLPGPEAREAARHLSTSPEFLNHQQRAVVETPHGVIGTMFVCPAAMISERRARVERQLQRRRSPTHLKLPFDTLYTHVVSLEHCEAFLLARFQHYQTKFGARLFFPDELIQYLAWRAEREAGSRPQLNRPRD